MIYLLLTVLAALLTYVIRDIAIKKAIVDIPNQRSSHTVPTPRGGGLAIVVVFYLGLVWLYSNGVVETSLFYAMLTALPVAATGLLDDLLDLSASKRLVIQSLSAAAALYFLGLPWYQAPAALFVIVWFTNLFNFLDGIDGYVGIETLFISLAGFYFFHHPLFLVLAAAAAGFLPFNWQKASIFMGDVGSTFIGFVLAVFVLYESKTLHDIFVWFLLTSPFWFDATYTLLRRLFKGEKVTQAHRKHLFQRAVRSGLSHETVTLGLLVMDLSIFILVLSMDHNLWFALLAIVFLFICVVYMIEKRVAFDVA